MSDAAQTRRAQPGSSTAGELIGDSATLDATLATSKKGIAAAVTASGTSLVDIYGVRPIGAAQIIGYVGDIARFETRAQFATCNGTAPVEVCSGGRTRHRLNPRANRKLNFAISSNQLIEGGPERTTRNDPESSVTSSNPEHRRFG